MPVFNCQKCNTPLQLPDQLAGKMFACPRCGQQLTIPSGSAAAVQAGAPAAPAAPPGAYQRGAPSAVPPPNVAPGRPPGADAARLASSGADAARDDYNDRPRRRRDRYDDEVGTLAAGSGSSSFSKPLLFGLMGALGCFIAALLICGPHILLMPASGAGGGGGTAKADVMFVLDISGSMQPSIDGVERGISGFVSEFEKAGLDVHVGLTVFRDEDRRVGNDFDAGIGGDPWTFSFRNGKAYTESTDEFRSVVRKVRADGGGDLPENSLEALQKAAGYPVRDNAIKVLILITDATYLPPGGAFGRRAQPDVPSTKKALLDNKVRQLHLIIGEPGFDGFRRLQSVYEPLWDKTEDPKTKTPVMSGRSYDLNDIGRGKGFNEILEQFKTSIVEEARKVAGLTGGAGTTYDSSQAWRLWIISALLFGFLAFGLALALIAGQRLYMRQSMLDGASFAKALVPLGAGLLAGFLIDLLFTSLAMPTAVGIILRTVGWTLVGAIIGLSMAFFIPNLKWYKGLLGGVIGGFAGGLLFNLITLVTSGIGVAGILIGDFLGAIILGFCIGVMVALAEVAFRRWWLEVRYGARETRTVTLGTAPVTVGSDERRATVVVHDVPALAMRYRLADERVLCEDLESGRRMELEPGDSRRIGNVTITVCSPETVGRLGLFLELSSGQKLPLSDGLPLTGDDLPGLASNSPDGTVAIVGKKPADPSILLLRNRSKQAWTVYERNGSSRTIDPGLGLPLEPGVEINFGKVQGRLVRSGGGRRR